MAMRSFQKGVYSEGKEFSFRSKVFSLRVEKERKNENDRVSLSESVPIHLNNVLSL